MSLIKCPACGKDVSEQAPSCPHCGEPLKKLAEDKEILRILVEQGRAAAISRILELHGCDLLAAKKYLEKIELLLSFQEFVAVRKKSGQATIRGLILMAVLSVGVVGLVYYCNMPTPPPPPPPLTAEQEEFGLPPTIIYGEKYQPIVRAVRDYLVPRLKDPDSLRFVQFTNPSTKELQGKKGWIVVVKYRARNSFGGYGAEEAIALIRDDQVILWMKSDGTVSE